MEWTAPIPPPFVMFRVENPPGGMFYAPSEAGTRLAYQYIERWLSTLNMVNALEAKMRIARDWR